MPASRSPICRNVSRAPPASGKTSTPGHGPSPSGTCSVPSLWPSAAGMRTSRHGIRLPPTRLVGGDLPNVSPCRRGLRAGAGRRLAGHLLWLPGRAGWGGPDGVGGAFGEALFVDLDLEGDHLKARGERGQLGGDALLMLAQDGQPAGLVARALPDQFGVVADRGQ